MCQKVVKLHTANGSFYCFVFTVWRTTSLLYNDWWCRLLCSTQSGNQKLLSIITHVTPSNIKWCFICITESRLHSLFLIWLYDFEILFLQNDDKICTQLQMQVKMEAKHPLIITQVKLTFMLWNYQTRTTQIIQIIHIHQSHSY